MFNPRKLTGSTPPTQSLREKFISAIIAFIGLLLLGLVSTNALGDHGLPFMVASMGASAVLLFTVPHSPLSQPWPLLGGHLFSSTIGVSCALYIPDQVVAAALAVSLSIAAMYIARCLHPPGGAIALAAVLGGEQVTVLGYKFVLFPVMLNAILMFIIVLLLNNMVPGRRYPSNSSMVPGDLERDSWTSLAHGFSDQDLLSGIKSMDEFVDISKEQIDKIYQASILEMRKRQMGDILCKHIMTKDVISIKENVSLLETWKVLQKNRIKALPIVDQANRVCGIITKSDLATHYMKKVRASTSNNATNASNKTYKQAISPSAYFETTPVGALMRTPVTTVSARSHVVDVIPIFLQQKIHQLPVVDDDRLIAGMLTRSDLLSLMGVSATG